jgi:hypothetical protein
VIAPRAAPRCGIRLSARWYDERGERKSRGGFETKTAAPDWLNPKVDEVLALRRGDLPRPATLPTVDELIDNFLASHEVDPATINKLKYELAPRPASGTNQLTHGRADAADSRPDSTRYRHRR